MKYTKITTWFLAISMVMFGILKFVDPFKSWYAIQVSKSGLGQSAYFMGIAGEIAVGITLFICLIYGERLSSKGYAFLKTVSYCVIIIIMVTGIYVHLHPNVPGDVLPLKIKPPYIPIFFLLIALSNIVRKISNSQKQRRVKHKPITAE